MFYYFTSVSFPKIAGYNEVASSWFIPGCTPLSGSSDRLFFSVTCFVEKKHIVPFFLREEWVQRWHVSKKYCSPPATLKLGHQIQWNFLTILSAFVPDTIQNRLYKGEFKEFYASSYMVGLWGWVFFLTRGEDLLFLHSLSCIKIPLRIFFFFTPFSLN